MKVVIRNTTIAIMLFMLSLTSSFAVPLASFMEMAKLLSFKSTGLLIKGTQKFQRDKEDRSYLMMSFVGIVRPEFQLRDMNTRYELLFKINTDRFEIDKNNSLCKIILRFPNDYINLTEKIVETDYNSCQDYYKKDNKE